ncbi:hypothetical protein [Halobellus salinisoli]|uniref:hypothetical protein n=1 Tax=Halobellus salinisoli TaxID=3108500 RepID=UPI00300BE7FE
MSHESDADRTVSVADEEVRVEKSFEGDEFPVPAVKFRVTSESDAPAHIRLVDQIPEDFPMESVGFHPDYESDNWTAYKDHRVEYERTLDPGEETVTVYGIRLDQSTDVSGFLGEPILERPPAPGETGSEDAARDVEDILGADRSQLVRDALQGNGRLVSESTVDPEADERTSDEDDTEVDGEREGVTADGAAAEGVTASDNTDASAEPTATPRALEADLTPAVREERGGESEETPDAEDEETLDAESVGAPATETEDDDAAVGLADSEEVEGGSEESTADEYVDVEAHVDDSTGETAAAESVEEEAESAESEVEPTGAGAGDAADGLAATLAAEIRSGGVDEDDLDVLREELDAGLPRSADVRLRRVQAQMEDLNAYADAIAEFIDEEGTGAELVERLDTELTEIDEELDGLRDDIEDAAADREELRDDVSGVDETVDAVDERVGALETRLDDVAADAETAVAGVGELHERAEGIESQVEATTDRVGSVETEVEAVVDDVGDVAADVEDVAASVDDVSEDIDELGAHVTRLDEEMGDVREDIAAIDGDVVDVQESLEAELDELRAEVSALSADLDRIDSIEAEIEELQTFRDRLNNAFGPPGEE